MKKITSILLVVLLVLTCLTMAACDPTDPTVPFDTAGAREKLDLYIFEEDGQVIFGEFVLPGNIGGFDATWTSSSEFVVLTEVPASEENGTPKQYAVKVGYPETVTEVTLTVALSADVTKTFTVIVNPLSVHDFIKAYSFQKEMDTVVADFALDRTFDFAGETATIDWSVDEAYADYLEISEDGNTCVVYPTSLNPNVKINATFTYNGHSATKSYKMTVSEVKEHLQAVDYWYANTGVGMEMRGYVVEIATVFAPNYGNISLYIVDEDFCAGYYLYRVKCDQATADRLVPGAPVVVTGTVNTNYNGLIETNSGGTIVIDDEREALTELPVHALDEEVVGGLFSANYHQSTLVSLTNWKVKKVEDAPAAGATATLFILEKGGVEVSVAVSKYLEGAYLTKEDDAVWSALAAHGIQVGDIVSVTGVLGNYKGHQIMPLSIDGIVKGETESTYTAGVTAAAAVKAIDKALVDNGLNNVVAVEKNVALPTVDGATITAKALGASRAVSVVDGAIVVTPGKLENACVQFDITVGEFTNSIFRYIKSADLDDAEKLAMELPVLDIDFELAAEDTVLNLPATGSVFPAINVTWAFKADTTHDCATLDGNVLTITLPEAATSITVVATLSLGEAEVLTKEFTIAVDAATTQEYIAKFIEAPVAGTYKFAMVQANLGETLYFDGNINSSEYLTTTNKAAKAADVVVAKVGDTDTYTIMVGDKYVEIYTNSSNKVRPTLSATATGAWTWNSEFGIFTWDVDGTTYYLGSYNTFDTISASKISYVNADNIHVSQFVAVPCTLAEADWKVEAIDAPEAGTYKFVINQGNLGKTLYFDGNINSNEYLTATEKLEKAADVVLAKVGDTDTYTIMVGDKYVEIYTNSSNKVRPTLSATATGAWTWNSEFGIFTWDVDGTTYYLGTYNTFDTFSASKISYVNADNIHVSQFVAQLSTTVLAETEYKAIEAPVAGTYKFAMNQGNLGEMLYFDGNINSSEYLTTTNKYAKAADVVLAKVGDTDTYTIMVGDKYVEIYTNSSNKVRPTLSATATGAWTWNSEFGIFTWDVDGTTYYLGTYNTFDTISASKISYVNADNIHVSQFVAQLGVKGFVEADSETPDEGGETPTPAPAEKVTTIADALKAAVGTEAELSGTVVGLGTWNTQYNNWDVTISDGTNLLLVFRCTNHDLGLGDVVSVVGTIGAYNNVNQIAQGSTVTVVTAHVCTFDPADCDTPATCPVCEKTDGEALGHVDENPADGTCDRCQANLQQASSQVTASKTIAELITSEGWDSTTTKQTFKLDENVTVAINGGSNTGKAYNGDHIRIYATDSPAGTITISVPEGYELVSVKITTQVGTYAFLYLGEGTTDISNVETAVSGQSVVLNSVKNGDNGKQVRVTAIEVVYRPVQA